MFRINYRILGQLSFFFASSRPLFYSYSPSPTRSEGGTLSEPRHPSFFDMLDLKDSEKLGVRVTLWIHSFLLKHLKKVLKNHNFLEKLENLYSLMMLAKYY